MLKILKPILFFSAAILFSCKSDIEQITSENEEMERVHSLPDELKKDLSFNYTITEEYDHDNISLFDPELKILRIDDSIVLNVSFVETGSPTLEGGFELVNKTLKLSLLDKYPDVACGCEEYYDITFKIPEEGVEFKEVVLLEGELVIHIYPGLEAGTMKIMVKGNVRK